MGSLCFHVHIPHSRTSYLHTPASPSPSPSSSASLAFGPTSFSPLSIPFTSFSTSSKKPHLLTARARKENPKQEAVSSAAAAADKGKSSASNEEEDGEYEEVEISWLQEKAENLYENVGVAVNYIPGPRVGSTSLPWLLAVPLGYLSITLVIAVVKTVLKFNSPKAKRRRLVDKNAFLCTFIDEYFPTRRLELDTKEFKSLESKTDFTAQEILRKYIRYALNEKPFNPDLVASLIHLRKVSELEDFKIVEVLNDVSQRIVKEKGPVLMDTRGLTEKGVKRKAAVQALFSKLLYLSELDEFCQATSRASLRLKEIFGVTDEDAYSIRIETLSEIGDMESLEKMVPPGDSFSDQGTN
eukprot:c16597_g1_i1 orf=610-1674(+)